MIDKAKFSTKKELFSYLIENKAQLAYLKKSVVKYCNPIAIPSKNENSIAKVITDFSTDDLKAGIINRTIVGNTYCWMDSHDDVHIPGIFSKSISENKNTCHLHDHIYELTAKVGDPLKVYEDQLSWKSLGVNMVGNATCLLMDSSIKKSYNEQIYEMYLNNQITQHSVGMIYVNLFLCINDSDCKEEFANWNTYIPYVANSDQAVEEGYFWAVTEAKLKEISCVLAGSNELTPTIEGKIEPSKGTQKIEPGNTTHKINYNFLLKNLKNEN